MATLTEQQIQDRKKLRQELLSKRRQLNPEIHRILSAIICQKIINSTIFKNSQTIACYLSANNEVDLTNVIQTIWQQKKQCYIPIISQSIKHHMDFIRYDASDELQCNKYGINEPYYQQTKLIKPQQLDLVLMPIVGFDDNLNRLGYGGGYYDYTFAFLHKLRQEYFTQNSLQHKLQNKPYLLGIAFSWQKLEKKITALNTDIALDAVITDIDIKILS